MEMNFLIISIFNIFLIHDKPHKEHWLWSEIDEVITLDEDIMLHKYPNFHYIPANGFSSIEEKSRFKKLAKENGKLR